MGDRIFRFQQPDCRTVGTFLVTGRVRLSGEFVYLVGELVFLLKHRQSKYTN